MTERTYVPIACGLVDELQLRALRRSPVRIRWTTAGEVQEADAVIADVRTRDGAEFAVLADGRDIRLDDLLEVDGIGFGAEC